MPRMKDQISALPNEQKVSASRQERGCYTVDDLAQILGVGHKAIYALIHKKAFPASRIRSIGYRIPKCTFNNWMHQQ